MPGGKDEQDSGCTDVAEPALTPASPCSVERAVGNRSLFTPRRSLATASEERKSERAIEPIATRACADPARADAGHQRLLHFALDVPWSDDDVRREAARYALDAMTAYEPVDSWIIDDARFLKQSTCLPTRCTAAEHRRSARCRPISRCTCRSRGPKTKRADKRREFPMTFCSRRRPNSLCKCFGGRSTTAFHLGWSLRIRRTKAPRSFVRVSARLVCTTESRSKASRSSWCSISSVVDATRSSASSTSRIASRRKGAFAGAHGAKAPSRAYRHGLHSVESSRLTITPLASINANQCGF